MFIDLVRENFTTTDTKQEQPKFKTGVVAIVGRPNTGKSTLLNNLLDYKLSAVSPRPQTTRHNILGVLSGDNYQIIFLDTPGLPLASRDELNRRLFSRALEGMDEADLIVLMVEARRPGDIEQQLIEACREKNKPCLLVINKIDKVKKADLLSVTEEYQQLNSFAATVTISALKKRGLGKLKEAIINNLTEGEPVFPADELTDRTERFLVGEMIRECIFNNYSQEVPYAVAVEISEFRESSSEHGGKDYIEAVLYVERQTQKGILIGRGGEMLKKIGTQARQKIEEMLGRSIYLQMWVKVYPGWRKDKAFLKRIGY